jgi:multimeric flavodoxin WrbA
MNIALINGSPKLGSKSNTGILLNFLRGKIDSNNKIFEYAINKKPLDNKELTDLCGMDSIVIAFPLYVDAIPSHLLRMMVQLDDYIKSNGITKHDAYVYIIINNGFYKGKQNTIALQIVKNWCEKTGFNTAGDRPRRE